MRVGRKCSEGGNRGGNRVGMEVEGATAVHKVSKCARKTRGAGRSEPEERPRVLKIRTRTL